MDAGEDDVAACRREVQGIVGMWSNVGRTMIIDVLQGWQVTAFPALRARLRE
jgi:hypothetical protein